MKLQTIILTVICFLFLTNQLQATEEEVIVEKGDYYVVDTDLCNCRKDGTYVKPTYGREHKRCLIPQPRVLNLAPQRSAADDVNEFLGNLNEQYKEREDKIQINRIIDKYQKNRTDPNAWEDAQIKLQKSNISNSKKIEAQNFLNNIANHR